MTGTGGAEILIQTFVGGIITKVVVSRSKFRHQCTMKRWMFGSEIHGSMSG